MQILEIIIIAVVFFSLFGLGGLVFFKTSRTDDHQARKELRNLLSQYSHNQARSENILRDEIARIRAESAEIARLNRMALADSFKNLADSLHQTISELSSLQKEQFEKLTEQQNARVELLKEQMKTIEAKLAEMRQEHLI